LVTNVKVTTGIKKLLWFIVNLPLVTVNFPLYIS